MERPGGPQRQLGHIVHPRVDTMHRLVEFVRPITVLEDVFEPTQELIVVSGRNPCRNLTQADAGHGGGG